MSNHRRTLEYWYISCILCKTRYMVFKANKEFMNTHRHLLQLNTVCLFVITLLVSNNTCTCGLSTSHLLVIEGHVCSFTAQQVRPIWGHHWVQQPSRDPAAANLRDSQLKWYHTSLKHTSFFISVGLTFRRCFKDFEENTFTSLEETFRRKSNLVIGHIRAEQEFVYCSPQCFFYITVQMTIVTIVTLFLQNNFRLLC